MILYIAIFLVAIFYYLVTLRDGGTATKPLLIFMAALALFVGFGDMLGGYDRYIYGELFDTLADNLSGDTPIVKSYIYALYSKEMGYIVYNAVIAQITSNRYIFILITTMVIYGLYYTAMKQFTRNHAFAMILFMALMFFFTFTYLRQMISAGIVWVAMQYVIKRKPIQFFVLIALAVSFHNSAIIVAPLYFVPIRKFNIPVILGVMAVALVVGMSPLPSALFDAYGEATEATNRAAQYAEDTSGFRVAYLLEAAFFLFVILSNYKSIGEDKTSVTMLNVALIFCAVLLVFVKSENGGRLGWFFMIGVISIVGHVCTLKREVTGNALLIIAVSCFLYVRVLNAWGNQTILYPYKTFLTDGVRDGDWVHDFWEYDKRYDIDKFYR